MIKKLVKVVFGTQYDREMKKIRPLVEAIKEEEAHVGCEGVIGGCRPADAGGCRAVPEVSAEPTRHPTRHPTRPDAPMLHPCPSQAIPF